MQKKWYESMTFWGAVLLGATAIVEQLASTNFPKLLPLAEGLGIFLTAFGIRRAIK